MNGMGRRDFLSAAGRAGAGVAAAGFLTGTGFAGAVGGTARKVRVGQIGTGHAHAAGKMAAMRKLSDEFEVVGIVEKNRKMRDAAKKRGTYGGLRWMSEVELPRSPGRYDEQMRDFARIVRGEKETEYTPEHDLVVHETTLRASGVPVD